MKRVKKGEMTSSKVTKWIIPLIAFVSGAIASPILADFAQRALIWLVPPQMKVTVDSILFTRSKDDTRVFGQMAVTINSSESKGRTIEFVHLENANLAISQSLPRRSIQVPGLGIKHDTIQFVLTSASSFFNRLPYRHEEVWRTDYEVSGWRKLRPVELPSSALGRMSFMLTHNGSIETAPDSAKILTFENRGSYVSYANGDTSEVQEHEFSISVYPREEFRMVVDTNLDGNPDLEIPAASFGRAGEMDREMVLGVKLNPYFLREPFSGIVCCFYAKIPPAYAKAPERIPENLLSFMDPNDWTQIFGTKIDERVSGSQDYLLLAY